MTLLEKCPHCGANVIFNGTVCPNCTIDRERPDPKRVDDLHSAQARQERAIRRPAPAWWKPLVVLLFLAMLASLLYKPNAINLLSVGIGAVTGLLALRKGYNFFLWALASGVVGLIILAFLPFANRPEQDPEQSALLRDRAHRIAGVLVILGVAIQVVRFLGEMGIRLTHW